MCAVTIPAVTVVKGLRFTTGVTVHFPEKSMVWILHAGNWVVRLCWKSVFEPRALIANGAKKLRAEKASADAKKASQEATAETNTQSAS